MKTKLDGKPSNWSRRGTYGQRRRPKWSHWTGARIPPCSSREAVHCWTCIRRVTVQLYSHPSLMKASIYEIIICEKAENELIYCVSRRIDKHLPRPEHRGAPGQTIRPQLAPSNPFSIYTYEIEYMYLQIYWKRKSSERDHLPHCIYIVPWIDRTGRSQSILAACDCSATPAWHSWHYCSGRCFQWLDREGYRSKITWY